MRVREGNCQLVALQTLKEAKMTGASSIFLTRFKRCLLVFLSFVLALALCPALAYADDGFSGEEIPVSYTHLVLLDTLEAVLAYAADRLMESLAAGGVYNPDNIWKKPIEQA